uniref:Putative ovule protein n=1 Tax=Solanum chacoense TaxID=4108 RepID=A0A0V0H6F3_SOLCH
MKIQDLSRTGDISHQKYVISIKKVTGVRLNRSESSFSSSLKNQSDSTLRTARSRSRYVFLITAFFSHPL